MINLVDFKYAILRFEINSLKHNNYVVIPKNRLVFKSVIFQSKEDLYRVLGNLDFFLENRNVFIVIIH